MPTAFLRCQYGKIFQPNCPGNCQDRLTKMPRNICWHAAELFGDKILVVGGHTTYNISNVLMCDIKKNKCEELAPLPYPLLNMATVKWADNVIVIGGGGRGVIIYNVKTQKSHWLPPMRSALLYCCCC